MVPKCTVTGISVSHSVDNSRKFYVVALADVAIPELEMSMRGVGLARSGNKWIAIPPKSPGFTAGNNPVRWNVSSGLGAELRDEILDAYYNLTGREPPTREVRDDG